MDKQTSFQDLGLSAPLLQALTDIGYSHATPIQTACIPLFLDNKDLLAQAATGTGKTAAFSLPIIQKIDLSNRKPQALILTPTRELAAQVSQALKDYGKHLSGFSTATVYGGQSYSMQLSVLKRGAHVIVATPGRMMDLLRQGHVSLASIKMFVLDEADEMLKMGFQEDVEWILSHLPTERQTGLFSATIPPHIKRLVDKYLKQPVHVQIAANPTNKPKIDQFYTVVGAEKKLDALDRFLAFKEYDGSIIFAKTKQDTIWLAEQLETRGYSVEALNGDLKQAQRERVVNLLKKGVINIVVATDVAARGLDIDRIDLVINYELPQDRESYVHRIGRTGRAGRHGESIIILTPREKSRLRELERIVQGSIQATIPPTLIQIQQKKDNTFKNELLSTINAEKLEHYKTWIRSLSSENTCSELEIAAALAFKLQGSPTHLDTANDVWFVEKKSIPGKESKAPLRWQKKPRKEGGYSNNKRPFSRDKGSFFKKRASSR